LTTDLEWIKTFSFDLLFVEYILRGVGWRYTTASIDFGVDKRYRDLSKHYLLRFVAWIRFASHQLGYLHNKGSGRSRVLLDCDALRLTDREANTESSSPAKDPGTSPGTSGEGEI